MTWAVTNTGSPLPSQIDPAFPEPRTWMVRAPVRKTAPITSARETSALRWSKYAADTAHTSAAITHQLGGRHKCCPAQSPPANDNAAQSNGCRGYVRFCRLADIAAGQQRGTGTTKPVQESTNSNGQRREHA